MFHELRARKRALAQLERWTEDNIVDGLLSPNSYESSGDTDFGDNKSQTSIRSPHWVDNVLAIRARCDSVDCELRRLAALRQQRFLVTFDLSHEKAIEQELQDATVIVHESLRAAESLLSAPENDWSSALQESNAALSSRLNARRSLAKRLQKLGTDFSNLQQGFVASFTRLSSSKETCRERDRRQLQPP